MNESTNSHPVNARQQTELELLHSVLSEEASYPWNPYSSETADYLDRLEHDAAVDMEDDIVVDSQWSKVSTLAAALWPSKAPLAALSDKFGTRMPADLLEQLASQVQAAADSGQALVEQLVVSAQAVLTGWSADDLRVMARPALAMRSGKGEQLESLVESIRPVDWDELTEIEQARLTLAIARYALAKLEAES